MQTLLFSQQKMIYYFQLSNGILYLITISFGLFMSMMDLFAIEANANIRPMVFFKTRKMTYMVSDLCFNSMTISIIICYFLTWNMIYIIAFALAWICHVFNEMIFRPINDRLCALETFEHDDYSRKGHNHLIIQWTCLQAIKVFMISLTYLFISMPNIIA